MYVSKINNKIYSFRRQADVADENIITSNSFCTARRQITIYSLPSGYSVEVITIKAQYG